MTALQIGMNTKPFVVLHLTKITPLHASIRKCSMKCLTSHLFPYNYFLQFKLVDHR